MHERNVRGTGLRSTTRSIGLSYSGWTQTFDQKPKAQRYFEENHRHVEPGDALTVASKWGKTMKAKAQSAHHADEITSKAANALGIYRDLNHR